MDHYFSLEEKKRKEGGSLSENFLFFFLKEYLYIKKKYR